MINEYVNVLVVIYKLISMCYIDGYISDSFIMRWHHGDEHTSINNSYTMKDLYY